MKHLFIINPIAGGKDNSPRIKPIIEKAFSDRNEAYEVYITKCPLDATEKVKSEAASGEELRVYSCGGDGTFNECVTGAIMKQNVSVVPFPEGTGNDFCRMFGDEKSLFTDIEALINGSTVPIDVISCNGRYSVNICSVGLDARIGTNVHQYSKWPLIGGATAYVVSAIVEIAKGLSEHMHIMGDNLDIEGLSTIVCACNGRFYGGGFNPSPDAMPNDGIIDLYIVRKVNIFTLLALILDYAKGKAAQHPKYIQHMRVKRVSIEFDHDSVINLDGEALHTNKVDMEIMHEAVNLIVPRGMEFFG